MLETKGIPREVIDNATLIFNSAQYILESDEHGEVGDKIWLFPLFSKSWAAFAPIKRVEGEEIETEAMETRLKQALEADNEQLMGFAYVESYFGDPRAVMHFGFFDTGKHMATKIDVLSSKLANQNAWQLFLQFNKKRMEDIPFDQTSQEMQDLAAKLVGED